MIQGSLREIEISNFKSFGKKSKFPISPITLIFGPNSSGKSSFFQSLLMLQQSLSNNTPYELTINGELTQLSSYKNFIHNHDLNNDFSIGFTFSLTDNDCEAFYSKLFDFRKLPDKLSRFLKFINTYEQLNLTMTFGAHDKGHRVLLKKVALFIGNGEKPLLSYAFDDNFYSEKNYYYSSSNLDVIFDYKHKFWKDYLHFCIDNPELKIVEEMIENIEGFAECASYLDLIADYSLKGYDFIISPERLKEYNKKRSDEPYVETEFNKAFETELKNAQKYFESIKQDSMDFEKAFEILKLYIPSQLSTFLDVQSDFQIDLIYSNELRWEKYEGEYADKPIILFMILTQNLAKHLSCCRYIPPIRKLPLRIYEEPSMINLLDNSGSFMVRKLYEDPDLLEIINNDLETFEQNYYLQVVEYESREPNLSELLYTLQFVNRKTGLWSNFTDVGFGFSQLLPIITTLRSSWDNLIMIEQPELHLHPAMQAELGDLFISSVFDEKRSIKNSILAETHSEHLILRILRRIRETSEGRNTSTPPIYPEDVSVLYVLPSEKGSQVIHLPISKDGDFEKEWPNGFFDERDKELFF
jgi:predicted ATPase